MTTTTHIPTAVADVVVGAVIVFGIDNPIFGFQEADRDTVVKVDALGLHFAGGTYISADDHEVLVAG